MRNSPKTSARCRAEKRRKLATIGLAALLALTGCLANLIKPEKRFEDYNPPPPPGYEKTEYWAALPMQKDNADLVPESSGLKDGQDLARADVFFIHSTTFHRGNAWNARLDDRAINERTDQGTIKHQASVFNESCKVYAPRYRQATLFHVYDETDNGKKSLELAYSDVRAAFLYFRLKYNKERPLIIAGHEQGSLHAVRLLQEFFDDETKSSLAIRERLIAAYLPGAFIKDKMFKHIPACSEPAQIGCYVSWNTFMESSRSRLNRRLQPDALCVNPLTWKPDSEHGVYQDNKGGVPISFTGIDEHVADAECKKGVLLSRMFA